MVPVARHAEQYVNACQVVELGLGDLVNSQDIAGYLQRAYAENALIGSAETPPVVDIRGAAQAAAILLGFLQSRGIIQQNAPLGERRATGQEKAKAPSPL